MAVRLLRSALAAGAAGAAAVDFKFVATAHLKTHPAQMEVPAPSLWEEGPCVIYVARRLGCPLCRAGAADIHARRAEFLQRGVRLSVVVSQDTGIDEFVEAVWKGGEVLIDDSEIFKKALGGETYKNRWLLNPMVVRRIFQVAGLGTRTDDLNEKSNMLGGAMIVSKDGIHFAQAETSSFVYPSADTLLQALDAAKISCSPRATPSTAEATAT